MKRFTLRIDNYTYQKIKNMADYYHISLTEMIIELVQIGRFVNTFKALQIVCR